jgi:hypothetical protein
MIIRRLSWMLVLGAIIASVWVQPVAAAPASLEIEDELIFAAKAIGRIIALAGVLLLGLQLLGPGQSILAKVGLQVPPDYLIGALIGVILLGIAPDIVAWLFGLF